MGTQLRIHDMLKALGLWIVSHMQHGSCNISQKQQECIKWNLDANWCVHCKQNKNWWPFYGTTNKHTQNSLQFFSAQLLLYVPLLPIKRWEIQTYKEGCWCKSKSTKKSKEISKERDRHCHENSKGCQTDQIRFYVNIFKYALWFYQAPWSPFWHASLLATICLLSEQPEVIAGILI